MVAQVLKHQWVTTLVPLRKGAKPAEIFGLIFLVLVSLFLGGNYSVGTISPMCGQPGNSLSTLAVPAPP